MEEIFDWDDRVFNGSGGGEQCMAQAIQEASKGERRVPGVTNVMAIVMAGMTKVFVGEITAEGGVWLW